MEIKPFNSYNELIHVMDVLPVAVVIAKVDSREITYVNPSFCNLSGYSLTELINQPQTVLHPETTLEADSFSAHLNSLHAERGLETILEKLILKDGSFIHVDITANMLEVVEEKLLVGFFNPVSERVNALKDLFNNQLELNAVFDNSMVGILLLKDYRVPHQCNQRLVDILGYDSIDDMLGTSLREIHLNEQNFQEFGKMYYETLRHHENLQIEYPLRKKSGEEVWVTISGKALDSNIPADLSKGVVWVLDDITEQRKLKIKFENESQRYKSLMTLSADAIFIMSIDSGNIIECSDLASKLLGYSPEEMHALNIYDWDKEMTVESFHEYTNSMGSESISFERVHTRKDGSTYFASISARLIDSGSNKVLHATVRDVTRQKELEKVVTKERNLFRGGPTVVFSWEPSERLPVTSVSHNVEQVMGYLPEEVMSEKFGFSNHIHPVDLISAKKDVALHIQNQDVEFEQSYRFKVSSGKYRNFYDYTRVDYDSDGLPISIYGYLIDLTEYLEHQKLSQLLLENTSEGIFGIDASGVTTFANPAALSMLGFRETELIGTINHNLIHHSDIAGNEIPMCECNMMRPIQTGNDVHIFDEVLWRRDGTSFPVEYRSTPVVEEGAIKGVVVSFHDITEHKAQEQTITRLAYLDPLTDLPNRRYFNKILTENLQKLRYSKYKLILIMLDLDHFKDINDSFGHPVGDSLLINFADRVKQSLRESDFFARFGGDEFAILSQVKQISDVPVIAQKILNVLKTPFDIGGQRILTNVSLGIAEASKNSVADKLISRADIALYESKLNGRGKFSLYQSGMNKQIREELNVVSQLSHAVERNEFLLAYQPQIDTKTGQVVGIETLIRWLPEVQVSQEKTSPAFFIPLAEKRGLIHSISIWTVQRLIEDMQKIANTGYKGHISINISAELLTNLKGIQEVLAPLILHSGGEIKFDIEITETAFANLKPEVIQYLNNLNENDITLSIDDFGTGYSSLSMLRALNSNYVKIDKEFIDEVDSNVDDYAIVAATISMAHNLGKKVIAEGVENKEQFACLHSLNCDVIQGYYFARPMFLDGLLDFLDRHDQN